MYSSNAKHKLPTKAFNCKEWIPEEFVKLLTDVTTPKIGVGIQSDLLAFKTTFDITMPQTSLVDMSFMLQSHGFASGCGLKQLAIFLLGIAPRKLKSVAMSDWLEPLQTTDW